MDVSQTLPTEEDNLTCLFISLHHPQQGALGMFRLLPLGPGAGGRLHPADEPVRFGRDQQACLFALADPRVSRKQLSIQAFRTAHSPYLQFTVQNLSLRGRMAVNGVSLVYLERAYVGDEALVKFGDYEMRIRVEQGEAQANFEVLLDVPEPWPPRVAAAVPSMVPVMETGLSGAPADLRSQGAMERPGPMESDETLCLM
ncbi:TRAF-interacting protein with FHA domain-containing protein A [Merluccius polli]|uniref:TRAF-interacting protein with FHA domain-containing protein A n=1 Tax=Merluccius polli TaxID=89951 RepID=A0AA47PAZ6_MERPO|nr:TRAF-interacting protein with FHA domain-containing protein A [Merluccius polli]